MKVLLVFLVFSFSCFSSNAQLLDEGSTTTTVIDAQGNVEEVTETTVTIEHKTTGDILDGDTGIVTNKYEGDADVDWGGGGSIYSHSACTDAASGFPATGTDGRTSGCGHARSNSLTTWRQYVDLNSFGIEEGGEVNYEFLFAFPNSMYTNSGQTAYVQTKGYNDNTLQWETGLVTIDKTTFTQNPNNYTNNTNWVNTVTGVSDFSNQLDKVYIEIGGYGEFYWDEFQYNVVYNHITTVVDTWMQVVEQQQDIDTTIDLMNDYEVIDTFEQDIMDTTMEEMVNIEVDIPEVDIPDIALPTTEVSSSEEMLQDLEIDMPMMDVQEVAAEIEEMVAEIEDIAVEEPTEEVSSPIDEPELTEEVVEEVEPTEEIEVVEEVEAAEEVVEEVEVAEEVEATEEVVEEEPKEEEVKAEEKPTKQQEKKQEKAKEIIENFASNYDAVAQITTLALVNALGPNITTYSNQVVQPALQWYETEEIYTDVVMQDPLGNYFGVRDSLVFEQMIGAQYNE